MRVNKFIIGLPASLVLCALLGCPSKKKEETPTNPPQETKVEVETSTPSNVAKSECKDAPTWVGTKNCSDGHYAYASATAPRLKNPEMAAVRATDLSRLRLFDRISSPKKPEPFETVDVYACGAELHVLSRIPLPKETLDKLSTCEDGITESRSTPVPDCPEWISKRAWLDDDQAHAVSRVAGIGDQKLKEKAGRERAHDTLKKLLRGTTMGTLSAKQPSFESAECGQVYYTLASVDRSS